MLGIMEKTVAILNEDIQYLQSTDTPEHVYIIWHSWYVADIKMDEGMQ